MDAMINNLDKNRVLLIETGTSPEILPRLLARGQHQVTTTDSIKKALSLLRDTTFHLVVIGAADSAKARETAQSIRTSFPWVELVTVSTRANTADGFEIMQTGTRDLLKTHCTREELDQHIMKALEHGRMKQELTSLRQHIAMNYGFDNIVGTSRPIAKLKETIRRVAPTDIAISISGPPGSGKELLARVIHHHSLRRKNRFVTVDCSAIPESLFTSELFGEQSQADGTMTRRAGCLLMEADGGTIFFDDIDRLPPPVQPVLTNFLKHLTLPATGQAEPTKIDVRIISATSKNLETMVAEGCFSRELYFQLSVLPLTVPALSQRPEDIELLTEYFLRRQAVEMNRPLFEFTRGALDLLIGHNWPGNVRELENTLKRAAALCRENCIDADDILFIGTDAAVETEAEGAIKSELRPKSGRLDEGQRSIIIKALAENDWNFTQTAQELGIGRTTLWRKVKKYNLTKETVTP